MTDTEPARDEHGEGEFYDEFEHDHDHHESAISVLPLSEPDPHHRGGHRRQKAKRRGGIGCAVVLVVLALVVGGLYFGVSKGIDALNDRFGDPDDFAGPGQGAVMVEVQEGDTGGDIGRSLKEAGVVASVEAFTSACSAEPLCSSIQVGYYEVQEEMPARDALAVLIDPKNMVRNFLTVPEGLRLDDILDLLADKTEFKRKAYEKVLDKPGSIGLPDYAEGNAEGYLFPATYDLGPKATPRSILTTMVDRWRQAADEAGLEEAATRLGYTPAELMIVASLVEAEGRGDDMPKISRVIYNRLEGDETNGLLQIDASVNYGLQRDLGVNLTTDDLETPTPYNTYQNQGLPPTPIEAPGDAAIDAAANPVEGGWFYYVTVNLKTGETKFAEDYDEFLTYKAEYKEYCETSDAC
ncbi:endolytic transglycosylase MltG [Nocardioides pacificus]